MAKGGQQNNQPEQGDPATIVSGLKGIESAIRELIAEEDKVERDRQEQREISDLRAQSEMARWAKWMFWASFATIIVTLAGLLLIWRTLHHTRRAADSAVEMVAEAKETTNATKQMLFANRAYMAYDGYHCELGADPRGNTVGIDISVRLKNFGKSPARLAEVATWEEFLEVGSGPEPIKEELTQRTTKVGRFVPPDQTLFSGLKRVTRDQISQILAGQKRFFISVACRYEDEFGTERFTTFGVRVDFRGDIERILSMSEKELSSSVRVALSNYGNQAT